MDVISGFVCFYPSLKTFHHHIKTVKLKTHQSLKSCLYWGQGTVPVQFDEVGSTRQPRTPAIHTSRPVLRVESQHKCFPNEANELEISTSICRRRLSWGLVARRHKAIMWTNAELSKVFCGIHMKVISLRHVRELNSKHLFGDDTFYKLMPNTLSMIYDTSDKFAPFCDLLCFVMAMCWTIWCTFFIITSLQWRQMGTMVSLITSLAIVYSSIYSGADQRKYQSFASLAFVRGIHRDIAFNNVFSVLCDLVLRESQNIVLYLTTINPATLICYRMVPYLEKNMGFWCFANEVY